MPETCAGEFTAELRALSTCGAEPVGDDAFLALPAFATDMPIGAMARWNDKTAIVRISETAWKMAERG